MTASSSHAARHRARRLLLQALYQWHVGGDDPHEIIVQFVEQRATDGVDLSYFEEAMRTLAAEPSRFDQVIEPLLQRSLALVDPVERAVLRIAAYELLERFEIPARVVINEAIELAHEFGSEQGHRFVNGVVDRLAHGIRRHELGSSAASSNDDDPGAAS